MKFCTLLALFGVTQAIQLSSHSSARDVDSDLETYMRAVLNYADLGKCGKGDGSVDEKEMDEYFKVLHEGKVLPDDVLESLDKADDAFYGGASSLTIDEYIAKAKVGWTALNADQKAVFAATLKTAIDWTAQF